MSDSESNSDDQAAKKQPVIPKKTRPCEICKKTVRTSSYSKHLADHNSSPATCPICGKVAKNAASLRGHMFYMHKNSAQQYKCDVCNTFYRFKYRYTLHMKKMHGGPKTSMCETCGKTFFTVRELNLHNQATHLKLKKYVCQYCDKGFTTMQARKAHIRQHTDERPFVCNICDGAFRQKVNLQKHLRTIHDLDESEDEESDEDKEEEVEMEEEIPIQQPNMGNVNVTYFPPQKPTTCSYFIPTGPPTYIYPTL